MGRLGENQGRWPGWATATMKLI